MNFIEGFSKITRTDTFVNSGVGLEQELDPSQLDFAVIGRDPQSFLVQTSHLYFASSSHFPPLKGFVNPAIESGNIPKSLSNKHYFSQSKNIL